MIKTTNYQLGTMLQNILDNTKTYMIINERDVEVQTDQAHFLESVDITQKTYERFPTEDTLSVVIRSEIFLPILGENYVTFELLVENDSGEYPSLGKIQCLKLPDLYTDMQKSAVIAILTYFEQQSLSPQNEIAIACKLAIDDPWALLLEQGASDVINCN